MTELEKLQERKAKAESLPPEELEKHLYAYLEVCGNINELQGEYKLDIDKAVTATLIYDGLRSHYIVPKGIENMIFIALKNGDLKIINELITYFEKNKRSITKAEFRTERDILAGNIEKMCTSDDEDEIDKAMFFALQRIRRLACFRRSEVFRKKG